MVKRNHILIVITNSYNIKLWILVFCCSCVYTFKSKAQSEFQRLSIGDKIPDLVFNKVLNHPGGKAVLSDFRSNLLILDVWNRWCSSCIAGFPKMEKLKKQFSGNLNVILITDDSFTEIESLKGKSRILNTTTLPIAVDFKMINQLFPHNGVPLHIWIDSSGIVRSITNGHNTNVRTIQEFLNFGKANMRMRDNEILDFNSSQSLLREGNGRHLDNIQSYSIFLTAINNYNFSTFDFLRDTITQKNIGFKLINMGLPAMLSLAYPQYTNNIILNFDNAHKYIKPDDDYEIGNFKKDYLFCYEQKVIAEYEDSTEIMREILKNDLLRYFGLSAKEIVMSVESYILVKKGNMKELIKKNTHLEKNVEQIETQIIIKNASIEHLINKLSEILKSQNPYPSSTFHLVTNKTGYRGKITLELDYESAELDVLNKKLKKYGVELQRIVELRHVLQITKKEKTPPPM